MNDNTQRTVAENEYAIKEMRNKAIRILSDLDYDTIRRLADLDKNNYNKICYIYIILQEGYLSPLKVGISNFPLKRLQSMQTGSPENLIITKEWKLENRNLALSIESEIHDVLSKKSLGNEWFDIDVSIAISIIDKIIMVLSNYSMWEEWEETTKWLLIEELNNKLKKR